tara:strand:+ start:610 stop:870 length:261 start_codon:yes stop_codon:yes gene_type:complete
MRRGGDRGIEAAGVRGSGRSERDAPRREELDESSLAGFENLGIEVRGGEVDGAGVGADHQAHEGDREERDTHLDLWGEDEGRGSVD